MYSATTILAFAKKAHATGDVETARQLLVRAHSIAPDHREVATALVRIYLLDRNNAAAAATCYATLKHDPQATPIWNLLAQALETTNSAGAESACRRSLELDADNAETLFLLGNLLAQSGRVTPAIELYRRALAAAPGNVSILVNLGLQLDSVGDVAGAEACYRDALKYRPEQMEPLANLASLLFRQRRYFDARPVYDRLVCIAPHAPAEVWNNRGVCHMHAFDLVRAGESFQRAAELVPDDPRILANVAVLQTKCERFDLAKDLLDRASGLDPTRLQLIAQAMEVELRFADWAKFDERSFEILDGITSIELRPDDCVPPLAVIALSDDPTLQAMAAASMAAPPPASMGLHTLSCTAEAPTRPNGKIRVGFVGLAARDDAVSRSIINLIEHFDHDRFDVYLYAVAGETCSRMHRRIASVGLKYRQLQSLTTDRIVAAIRDDEVEILLDVGGDAMPRRAEILAERVAKMQINFMGHPGTLGAAYYDYLATDVYTTPPSTQSHYVEHFWYVDDCFYPPGALIPNASIDSRASHGLSDDAFVMIFDGPVGKIVPPMFDIWLRILARVTRAVLWVVCDTSSAAVNLRNEAIGRGIDPSKIVFTQGERDDESLSRYALADLFLDTYPFGSHANVSEVLCAGLPVLSIAGHSFASRVSATQIRAAGIPQMIARDPIQYEALAVSFATQPALRARIEGCLKDHVRVAATTSHLERYARAFQGAVSSLCVEA